MKLPWWCAVAFLAGCGTSTDDRPVTFETVTLEILAPSCGQVQCHSTSTNTKGYAFDTLEAARPALRKLTSPGEEHSLLDVLKASGSERMPPDSPLNQVDLDLIEQWIADGTPGL